MPINEDYKVKVYPDGTAVTYPIINFKPKKPYDRKNNITTLGKTLTPKTKRTIRRAVYALFTSKTNNFLWITFTLPPTLKRCGIWEVFNYDQFYTEKFSYCLNQLLKKKKSSYVWVAERQVRGAIHFHLAIQSKYIDVTWLNKIWVKSISEWHYESNNAVDLKKVESFQGIRAYISKYASKDTSRFFCRMVGMSQDISRLKEGANIDFDITPEMTTIESIYFEPFQGNKIKLDFISDEILMKMQADINKHKRKKKS